MPRRPEDGPRAVGVGVALAKVVRPRDVGLDSAVARAPPAVLITKRPLRQTYRPPAVGGAVPSPGARPMAQVATGVAPMEANGKERAGRTPGARTAPTGRVARCKATAKPLPPPLPRQEGPTNEGPAPGPPLPVPRDPPLLAETAELKGPPKARAVGPLRPAPAARVPAAASVKPRAVSPVVAPGDLKAGPEDVETATAPAVEPLAAR